MSRGRLSTVNPVAAPAGRADPAVRRNALLQLVPAALIIVSAFGWLVSEVVRYHIRVPYWDEWAMVDLIDRWSHHGFSIPEAFAQHNEHRLLFPRLAAAALIFLSGWNTLYVCMFGVTLMVGAWIFFVCAQRRAAVEMGGRSPWWAPAALAVVLFSLNQWENYLWGMQHQLFFNVFGVSGAVLALAVARITLSQLAIAVGLAVIATFSFANGLLIWPVGFVVLLCRRTSTRFHVAWAVAGIAAIALYFYGFQWPSQTAPRPAPISALMVALRVLGAPVSNYRPAVVQAIAGLTGVLLTGGLLGLGMRRPGFLRASAPFIGLFLYVGASALLVGVGRGAPLPDDEIASKYVTVANLLWVALVALLALAPAARLPLVARGTAAALIAIAASATALAARPHYQARDPILTRAVPVLFDGSNDSLLSRFYPDAALLRTHWLPTLRALRMSVFNCGSGETADEWRKAAQFLEQRIQPQDPVVASNDWAAECLARFVSPATRARITSVAGNARDAAARTADRPSVFLVAGGDVGMSDAADWMSGTVSIFASARRAALVYYYPNRASYLRERLTAPEHLHYENTLWETLQGQMIVAEQPLPFLIDGWSGLEKQPDGRVFRWADGGRSRMYVPVMDRRPRRLQLDVTPFHALASQSVTVSVDGTAVATLDLPQRNSFLDVDLASADWRPGGHVVELMFAATARPAETMAGSIDTRSLAAQFRSVRLR